MNKFFSVRKTVLTRQLTQVGIVKKTSCFNFKFCLLYTDKLFTISLNAIAS